MMTFVELDINAVHESAHNPRRHFDEEKLKQLAANIAQVGILTPLTVRPAAHSTTTSPSYEIGAGHRRYRAAKLAQLSLVPCLVREMRDQEFMELLNIENLQHEGLHPLDEAQGYADLMAAPYTMKVETVAEKVGRSVKYVYDRIKLLALTKPAQHLFWAGRIEAGHAILLARLTPTEQAKVIGTVEEEYANGGLFQEEHRLFMPDEEQGDEPHVKPVSVRELQAWIDQHIRFTGRQIDSMLFPETAAQVTNATEMKRKIIEITHEYLTQDDVRHADQAKVYGERAWQRADGEEDSKVCVFAVLGVIASGPGRGQAFDVCVRKDKCLVHWGKEIRDREKRQKDKEQMNTAAVTKADQKAEAQRKKQDEDYERQRRKRVEWEKLTPAVMKAVEAKLPSMKVPGLLGDLLCEVFEYWRPARTGIPRGKSAEDLIRHLAGLRLYTIANEYDGYEKFTKLAKHLGIDLSKILKADHKASQSAPAPAQTSALVKKARRKKAA